ncbi:MAG: hypothetical protein ACK518_01175 [bacterium]
MSYSSDEKTEYDEPSSDYYSDSDGMEYASNNYLLDAIRNNDIVAIETLIDSGIEIRPIEFSTAVKLGNLDVIRTLLYNGAIISFNDLLFVITRGFEEIVREFIDSGMNINQEIGRALESTVYINDQTKRLNILEALLFAGAQDPEGTALELHATFNDNDIESVSLILEYLTYTPEQLKTVINEAISSGHLQIAFEVALYLNDDTILNDMISNQQFNLDQNSFRAAIRLERPDIALRIAVMMRSFALVRHLFDDLEYQAGPEAIEIGLLAGRLNLPDIEEYILSRVEMLP